MEGLIKGGVLGKLKCCEDNFSCLVWPSEGKLIKEVQFKNVSQPVKTTCNSLLTENIKESQAENYQYFNTIKYHVHVIESMPWFE